jgi:hypothetical protein
MGGGHGVKWKANCQESSARLNANLNTNGESACHRDNPCAGTGICRTLAEYFAQSVYSDKLIYYKNSSCLRLLYAGCGYYSFQNGLFSGTCHAQNRLQPCTNAMFLIDTPAR